MLITVVLQILLVVVIYNHASGKAKYNRALILVMCLLSLVPALMAAYVGYLHNPNKDNIKFREVL